jgi:predicted branched-subunit amino acid permease
VLAASGAAAAGTYLAVGGAWYIMAGAAAGLVVAVVLADPRADPDADLRPDSEIAR